MFKQQKADKQPCLPSNGRKTYVVPKTITAN